MATTSFEKQVNRIKKEDLLICMALWMEESPLAENPPFDEDTTDSFSGQETDSNETLSDSEPEQKRKRTEFCITRESKNISDGPSDTSDKDEMNKDGETDEVEEKMTEREIINKVGTVFVTRDGAILALDCSRDSLHGIVNVLADFHDRVKDCSVYVSRKPCSSCIKLMVHARVSRVFYLPLEPENPGEEDLQRADRLARVCAIGQSIYIPQIGEGAMAQSKVRNSPYIPQKHSNMDTDLDLLKRYWNAEWVTRIAKQLRWPEFESLKAETSLLMGSTLEWIARVAFIDIPSSVFFHAWVTGDTPLVTAPENENTTAADFSKVPDPNNSKWQELSRHWSRLAQILSQYSDDPRRGVGAVVVMDNRVVATGWNSYPLQTKYGDFPRASDNDPDCFKPKKYPFIIHAEQAAILGRNTSNISDVSTTLFVSKKPCDECVALLTKVGIRNVVFPRPNPKRHGTYLKYNILAKMAQQGKIRGFQSTQQGNGSTVPHSDDESMKHAVRHLQLDGLVAEA